MFFSCFQASRQRLKTASAALNFDPAADEADDDGGDGINDGEDTGGDDEPQFLQTLA